ncbi:MAG TPA: carboxypeptidase-like regulatory domain-containing protein [Chitinophagaceae bacterium]|jgi:hypothetical protein|nr:carboxypeptidase-like regulatory domain-containing protein [Chitinophagaceae bacterium]
MQRLIAAILLLGIAIMGLNCQKEVSFNGPGIVNNNPNPITATLQGNIKDENGRPAMGVTIKAGTRTTTTDARGYFRIANAALDKTASLLTAEKAGYFKSFRVFGATSGVNQVSIQLMKKTLAGSVTSASGGEVSLSNGSKIKLAANGIVKKSGGTYSGAVNVYAAYIDPTSSNISEIVPGSFLATDKNNNRAVLSSYGMMVVELESASGEKLQVAEGSVATLTTAIPASLQASAPATIPLWYVDEQTGIWKEEGTATKNGNNYVGDVKHFSFWNCDVPISAVNISLTLKNPDGSPLMFTIVRITAATTYGMAYGITDSLGQVSGAVPSNMALTLEVMTPCFTAGYSQNIGPFTSNTDLGTITTTINSNSTTVTGRLLNCSGTPVSNGRAFINFNNIGRYAYTANDGTFSSTFYTCTSAPATCEVTGIDNATQQQGLPVNVTLSNPASSAGDIVACGSSSLEYITFSIDGEVTTITAGPPQNYLVARCYDSTGVTGTNINCQEGAVGPSGCMLDFLDNRMPGTFPVQNLYIMRMGQGNYLNMIQPFNTTITAFPGTAGGFMEGGFSGQYLDGSGILHVITSTFRIRRQ